MFLIKTAWDNIAFHKKRSILSILLIAVASATILLYRGFVEYSERGLAISFIENSGHIEVAKMNFWDEKTTLNKTLDKASIAMLSKYFATFSNVKKYDAVLNFQGIIGNEEVSTIFWGMAYDDPSSLGATEGDPVFTDDASVVLGSTLFKKLNLKLDEKPKINMMSTLSGNELSAGTFEVSGNIDTGVPQNDAGLVIASRSALLQYFEAEDEASYMRIYLDSEQNIKEVQKQIDSYFLEHHLPYETRDWKTLNPTWKQISGLFNTQFSVISIILCVLIFVSLTQSISASFMERMCEFGTMEAIGLKKHSLITSLVLEILIIAIFGIAGGIAISHFGNFITETFSIKMIPPGYSQGYPLHFFITWASLFKTQFFILLTCFASVILPIYTIKKLKTIQLMRHSGA